MAVTQAIFGINVAVFIAMTLAGVSMLDNPSGQDLVRWGANFGPLRQWRVVAGADLRFHSRPLAAHRVQHVVSVEPWQTGGIGLRPLDVCRSVADHWISGVRFYNVRAGTRQTARLPEPGMYFGLYSVCTTGRRVASDPLWT